jgi:beta-phosphoglucomutase
VNEFSQYYLWLPTRQPQVLITGIMLRAVLFDMDGVLVDSEPFICRAAIAMFRERGLSVSAYDFLPFVGTGENRYIGGVAEKYGFPLDLPRDKARTYEIYEQITAGALDPLPGTLDFIGLCRKRGLKMAVATSADEIKMIINLKEIGMPISYFDATINGLQIKNKKPHPDIYLRAATLLGVDPCECLVVEDAPSGLAAGKAAGARCLGLTTSFNEAELSLADWIAPHLGAVPAEALSW